MYEITIWYKVCASLAQASIYTPFHKVLYWCSIFDFDVRTVLNLGFAFSFGEPLHAAKRRGYPPDYSVESLTSASE